MTLDKAINYHTETAIVDRIKADDDLIYPSAVRSAYAKRAEEHEQLAEWLTHYQAIRQIIHEWGCDYAPINPDKKAKHSKEEYFDMILATFEPKEAENE